VNASPRCLDETSWRLCQFLRSWDERVNVSHRASLRIGIESVGRQRAETGPALSISTLRKRDQLATHETAARRAPSSAPSVIVVAPSRECRSVGCSCFGFAVVSRARIGLSCSCSLPEVLARRVVWGERGARERERDCERTLRSEVLHTVAGLSWRGLNEGRGKGMICWAESENRIDRPRVEEMGIGDFLYPHQRPGVGALFFFSGEREVEVVLGKGGRSVRWTGRGHESGRKGAGLIGFMGDGQTRVKNHTPKDGFVGFSARRPRPPPATGNCP
jgi:hypothetical protein